MTSRSTASPVACRSTSCSRVMSGDPWGGDRAVFSARTRVNREDFGITWNQALEAGGLLVSREVQIDINLETVLSAD